MKVLLTGSQGFIGSYVAADLLDAGYEVVGIDNFSKYGQVSRPHDNHPKFKLYQMDARALVEEFNEDRHFHKAVQDCDFVIAGAALIGGISYFHAKAFDLLATNEEILASTFRMAIHLNEHYKLKRILVISSSMVFESTDKFPTPEGEQLKCPPPLSTYGFQKLSSEFFCKGAHEQYGLPFTIVRPFNCVGIGEEEALGSEAHSAGNVKMMLSHVLPDLIARALKLKSTDPFPILGEGSQLRCYTNGRDIARGIRIAMESKKAENNDFNISHPKPTSVLELAEIVWNKIHGGKPEITHLDPFEYDVQVRIPDVSKARDILGFEAKVDLEESVSEVIDWMVKGV